MAQDAYVNEKKPNKLTARRQINNELKHLQTNQSRNYLVTPNDDDRKEWTVDMYGPEDSPYNGGIFTLDVRFGKCYPAQPPRIKFNTRIYHMNVSGRGQICIASLCDEWGRIESMKELFDEIFELLRKPDGTAVVREDLAALFTYDIDTYNNIAKQQTEQHAIRRNNNSNDNNSDDKPYRDTWNNNSDEKPYKDKGNNNINNI